MKTEKQLLMILILFCIGIAEVYSQCSECSTLERDDATIRQCPTEFVAADQTIQIGLSVAYNGTDYYVNASVRHRNSSNSLLSPLGIHLENNKMVKLDLIKQQELAAGGSNLVQGFFIVTPEQLVALKNSNMKIIHITLNDGKLRPLEVSKNPDVLKIGFNCLN